VCKRAFNKEPCMTHRSPLEKGDHPELDDSDLCKPKDVSKHQSLIGALQWLVSLGRCDMASAVSGMGSFRTAPRQGHLSRLRRMVGYVCRMKDAAIRYRVNEPDYSDLPGVSQDWA
jgi:hypothetical protein